MQTAPPPPPPSLTLSVSSVVQSSAPTPDTPATLQPAGKGAAEQGQEGAVPAGTGEGEARGGQEEAGVGTATVEAAGAGGKRGGRGGPMAAGRRLVPFNPAESDRPGTSVVADILEVTEEEGEGGGRMVVAGGHRQLAAPNVQAPAMKSILPAVQRKEEGKCGQGRPRTRFQGHVGTGGHTGGRGRPHPGGKGQAGAPGARRTAEHQEGAGGKGGGQGHQLLQPQQSFGQPPQGSTPQVRAAVRPEEEREANGAVRGAGAPGALALLSAGSLAGAKNHLPAEDGGGEGSGTAGS